jgi:hypothetical protein
MRGQKSLLCLRAEQYLTTKKNKEYEIRKRNKELIEQRFFF